MATVERLAIFVEANAGKAIAEFRKVGDAAKQAGAGAEGGAKGLARFGIAGETASNLLKAGIAAGVAGAATAIAKFAVDGVNAFVEVTGEIRKFQRVSGATAEDASKLVAAFHVLGIDSDSAAAAIFQLSRRIESSGDKLAALGVTVARTKTGTVDVVETLLNVGDAYKATEDPAKRANLVFQAFGRGGAPIIPILGKTRTELEEIFRAAERHGLIFSQEQIDKGKEFAATTAELGESFKGLQVEVGERLVPVLSDLAIAITKAIDATHGNLGPVFKGLLAAIPGAPIFAGLAQGLHLIAGNEGEVTKEAIAAANALTEQETKIDELQKSIFTATDAQRSFEAAGRAVDEANRNQTKAQEDYNKLLKEGAVDEEKVADARRSLADATRSLHHAQREQIKAQGEYNEALAAFNILGTDTAHDKLTEATDNLADANDSVTSAQEANTKAAEDLKKAQAGDPDYQQKLADAKQKVADATQAAADATYNYGKRSFENVAAHDAETKAIADKADQVERLKADLDAMLKLNPEQFAFLKPILDTLGAAVTTGVPGVSLGGGGLLPGLTGPGSLLFTPGNVGGGDIPALPAPAGAPTTTNNVTINATGSETDARLIAKEVMWNLN